jgi:hypothetical protein
MCEDYVTTAEPIEVRTEELVEAISISSAGKTGCVADGTLTVVGTGTCRAYGKNRPVFVVYLMDGWEDTYVIFTNSITGGDGVYSHTAYPIYDHNWSTMWRQR